MAKTLAEKIAVMQAAERGEQIEWRPLDISGSNWRLVPAGQGLAWNWFACDYRVVKKPIKLTRYFIVGPEEIPASLPFTDKIRAQLSCDSWNAQISPNRFRVVAFEMTEIEANQNDTTS